jgi:carbon-monoxide dehydrogenase medium subunit
MYAFDYQRPATVTDAAALAGDETVFLAGGQTLIPTLKQRLRQASAVIDLGDIPALRGVTVTGDVVSIGAMTSHADVAASPTVRAAIPALANLAGQIGDLQVRNRGTLGGSIANNDPAADYPAALVALNAMVRTNTRALAAADFFTGMFETALQPGELVVRVDFPKPKRAAFAKFRNPASRYAIAAVFVADTDAGVRVAVIGAGPVVFRVPEMEAALAKDFSAAAIEGIAVSAEGLNADMHATAEYRAHLIGVMAARAVISLT